VVGIVVELSTVSECMHASAAAVLSQSSGVQGREPCSMDGVSRPVKAIPAASAPLLPKTRPAKGDLDTVATLPCKRKKS